MKNIDGIVSSFLKKYKNILCIFLVFIFLFLVINYEDDKFSFNLETNFNKILLSLAFLLVIFIILYEIRIIRKKIVFEENELVIIGKLFWIKIYHKVFVYENICKFIIGRCYNNIFPGGANYSIYLDYSDQIKKVYNLKTYKECMEIIEEIKKKTCIKIYDDTDNIYTQEEDLFRNYYKLKKAFEEIKHE